MIEKEKPKPEKKPVYSISNADRAARALDNARHSHKSWADRRKALSQSVVSGMGRNQSRRKGASRKSPLWRRETFRLSRIEAREKAKEFFIRYPKAAYWSEIESWRVLEDDMIEFTMRRLPSAD